MRRYGSLAELEEDPVLTRAALDEILDFASALADDMDREREVVDVVRAAVRPRREPARRLIVAVRSSERRP